MIQSIQYRKGHFLAKEEWRTLPCGRMPGKRYSQRLLDHGFALGAAIEEADNAGFRRGELGHETYLNYLYRFASLDTELDCWYRELSEMSPEPLYWLDLTQSAGHGAHDMSSASARGPFAFRSLLIASVIVRYWALKLVLSLTISMLRIRPTVPETSEEPLPDDGSVIALASHYNEPHRQDLAVKIIRSMSYLLDSGLGLYGAQLSLFPLRGALYILLQNPGEDLRRCQALYQELTNTKGLGYAREIAKTSGGYSRNNSPQTSPIQLASDLPYRVQATERPSDSSSGESSSCSCCVSI